VRLNDGLLPAARRSVFVNGKATLSAACGMPCPFGWQGARSTWEAGKASWSAKARNFFRRRGLCPRAPGIFEGKMMGGGGRLKGPYAPNPAPLVSLGFISLPNHQPALNSVLRYRLGSR